jgi:CDP-glucose 4,6-dehydratase
MFHELSLGQHMRSEIVNIRDLELLKKITREHQPEVVFHLAAQSLVRESYLDPVTTYATNVVGTVNLLESVRAAESVRAVVVVTTDKCYENREWVWAYRESDALGGHDPYSSSKACAELVVSAYRDSFYSPAKYALHRTAISTTRAGNVIGGGDWARDRLIPDIMRAFSTKQLLKVRNPGAVRPWQHVLEPLSGYLTLAEKMCEHGVEYGQAWNFGPEAGDAKPVDWIVRQLAGDWGADARWEVDGAVHPHEAGVLKLDCAKASHGLGWKPLLPLERALQFTADWYRCRAAGEDMRSVTCGQIRLYQDLQVGMSTNKTLSQQARK